MAIAGHKDLVHGPALLAFLHSCQSGKYGGFSKALGACLLCSVRSNMRVVVFVLS